MNERTYGARKYTYTTSKKHILIVYAKDTSLVENRYNKEIRKSEENQTAYSKRATQRNETETNGHAKKPSDNTWLWLIWFSLYLHDD